MKYGCIGEHLSHSFSKEIHNLLCDYEYEIKEIPRDELDEFMEKKDFFAINVTIPYKELVIPHLYYISDEARAIGAVNTVVNRGGRLYGYNTDFLGMKSLILKNNMDFCGRKVVILGTGGTSKTARAVSESLGAKEIITVSRQKSHIAIDYDEMYLNHTDADYIINTTPVGMYPDIYKSPVDLKKFKFLSGVIDAIYNPLSSMLVSDAKEMGIKASGGLYMLVKQAAYAAEKFIDTHISEEKSEQVYKKILSDKENIVLIGMPSSGKTTIGYRLSNLLGKEMIDTDEMIVKREGKEISKIFEEYGEEYFRKVECDVIREVSAKSGLIISTGGGCILNSENIKNLRLNGRLYFVDRSLENLTATDDRPLSSDAEALKRRYEERYDIYMNVCDKRVENNSSVEDAIKKILER